MTLHQCNFCAKPFRTKKALFNHIQKHHALILSDSQIKQVKMTVRELNNPKPKLIEKLPISNKEKRRLKGKGGRKRLFWASVILTNR